MCRINKGGAACPKAGGEEGQSEGAGSAVKGQKKTRNLQREHGWWGTTEKPCLKKNGRARLTVESRRGGAAGARR